MSKITIFLNGSARQIDADVTIPELIQSHRLPENLVLVEHNGSALHREQWNQVPVEHGDRIELMKMVAGG